jgi:fructoselysine-6-P-deglycase FrlB-like protein
MSAVEQEIADQPRCWRLAADLAAIEEDRLPATGERVVTVGCGTSFFIAQAFAALREAAGLGETDAFAASEMPVGRRYDLVVLITRSGTTTEVLDLVPKLAEGTRTLAVTADAATPINEISDAMVLDFADESSIVQTRFATSTLALLRAHLGEDVEALAHAAEQTLAAPPRVEPQRFEQFVFIGRGAAVGLANEAALKMRETGGAWSEAYPAMELRHGPISSLGPQSLVWCLGVVPDGLRDQVEATGASWIESAQDPMVTLTDIQRVAVANALARGLDPDRPRFLSRSVILPNTGRRSR